MRKTVTTLLLVISTITIAQAEKTIDLSPELMELLRAEMRALQADVQTLPVHIASANWEQMAKIGANLNASYIMAQKLTEKQKHELHSSLPERFKRMDADFHAEASKLETAANNHDAQLVSFHYYRLIETCTNCHAEYATQSFPGFLGKDKHSHQH